MVRRRAHRRRPRSPAPQEARRRPAAGHRVGRRVPTGLMTRRLTVTMVAVVAGALLVAGFGSLALIRVQSRRDTVADLRKQAQGIAQLVDEVPARNTAAAAALRQRVLQRVLKLTDQDVVRYTPAGQPLDPLPRGISASDLDFPKLQQ